MGKGFLLATIALAGFLFSLSPAAERIDDYLLDSQWSVLRKFAPKPGPDDIIVVGVDDASVRAIDVPPGLWHEPIGRALERIAAAHPRAIGIDLALPERSYEGFHSGLDRPLMEGLVAARRNGILVASLTIDSRTRSARNIHAPFLAALGEQGLGIGLLGRDADGVTRRFSLAVPTEQGAYPTLAGRLCRALSKRCTDGLIDYALGPSFRYVPLRDVLAVPDGELLGRLFRDRIALLGDVRASDRVAVPVNLAAWEEPGARLSPGVLVHAQSLRTALADAPVEATRPLTVLLVTMTALLALMSDWRLALASALLMGLALFTGATALLRSGLHVGIAAALLTMAVAALSCRWVRRKPTKNTTLQNFPQRN
jgi:CHASE2 domain-containing sensor protein